MQASEIHAVMVGKGFWDDVYKGQIAPQTKIVEQLLHLSIEMLEFALADGDDSDELEAADILIVLADLCAGVGMDFDLSYMPITTGEQFPYPAKPVRDLLDAFRKTGRFNFNHVKAVYGCLFSMYGKPAMLDAVQVKMERNKARQHRYGKLPISMTIAMPD